jgi:hypothetical protein
MGELVLKKDDYIRYRQTNSLNENPDIMKDFDFMRHNEEAYFEYTGVIRVTRPGNPHSSVVSADIPMSDGSICRLRDDIEDIKWKGFTATKVRDLVKCGQYFEMNATMVCMYIRYPGSSESTARFLVVKDAELI